jgi:tetratricopeptide (TPR) repeat protein
VRCSYCDSTVPDDSVFCPICGFKLEMATRPKRTAAEAASPGGLWYVALALLASALTLTIIGLGLQGVQDGLQERRRISQELGQEYYQRGLTYLEHGNYLLAQAHFEAAVRLAPSHAEARQQFEALQALVGSPATPGPAAASDSATAVYREAAALYAEERWEQVIAKLEELRRLDSAYRSQEVADMLFNAYQRQGLRLMDAGELEEASAHLAAALAIRPDDPHVAEQHYCLSLYLTGLSQWGVDWEGAVESFRELCELNPGFLEVEQRLHDACVSLGDLYYEEGAWCVAETQYGEALRAMVSDEAAAKRDQARDLCISAIEAMTPSALPSAGPAETASPWATVVPPP